MNRQLAREYRRFRAAGIGGVVGRDAANCLHAARTVLLWERLEAAGLVRLSVEPDDSYDWSEEERERYGSDGAWGVVGSYRTGERGEWEHGDSVWGFVGYASVDSPTENPYVIDIMTQTIEALRTALRRRCPACRRPAA